MRTDRLCGEATCAKQAKTKSALTKFTALKPSRVMTRIQFP